MVFNALHLLIFLGRLVFSKSFLSKQIQLQEEGKTYSQYAIPQKLLLQYGLHNYLFSKNILFITYDYLFTMSIPLFLFRLNYSCTFPCNMFQNCSNTVATTF